MCPFWSAVLSCARLMLKNVESIFWLAIGAVMSRGPPGMRPPTCPGPADTRTGGTGAAPGHPRHTDKAAGRGPYLAVTASQYTGHGECINPHVNKEIEKVPVTHFFLSIYQTAYFFRIISVNGF